MDVVTNKINSRLIGQTAHISLSIGLGLNTFSLGYANLVLLVLVDILIRYKVNWEVEELAID